MLVLAMCNVTSVSTSHLLLSAYARKPKWARNDNCAVNGFFMGHTANLFTWRLKYNPGRKSA